MTYEKANEPWLDVVPGEWPSSRIRNVALLSPSYSNLPPAPEELCAIVPMDKLSESGEIDTSDVQLYGDVTNELTLFEKGDVLFAKITPCMENGKGAYVESLPTRYAFGSTEFHVLRPLHFVDPKFLYYYTFNPLYRAYAAENMSGAAGQKRVSSRFLKDTRLFLPPLSEQKQIAEYLDKSCAAIDAAVAAKRRQQDILTSIHSVTVKKAVMVGLNPEVSLEQTNIPWIPAKPQHWKLARIKDVLEFYNTVRVPLSAEDRGLMTDKIYDYYGASGVIDEVESYLFDGSYILIAEDGANLLTRSKPLAFLAEGKFWVNNHAHILKPKWNGNIQFFINLLESLDYSLFVTGAAQPKLTMENLGRFKIAVPPVKEQEEIAEFIQKKEIAFRALFEKIGKQINSLVSYRSSLIHECVTGLRRISEKDLSEVKAYA